ncbi:MAG: protein BatD [Methylomonas sp.]|nr:protein BatD [Methylomonas sp.]
MLMPNRCNTVKWLLAVSGWLLACAALAADIRVSIDRNPVGLNESFQITFTAAETPDGNPDFTPLRANFEILNQERSTNMSWVNGKSSRTEQWVVSVMAKQPGELLIPPIAFGADSSQPGKVSVSDASQAQPGGNDEVFLTVEVTPDKPYVQSQVLYTLKLYRRVQITQASLNDPEIKDALVEKLGDDSTYSTQINGMDYWVTERKYAIFPQQSGLFTIAPLTLTAEVVSNANNRRPRFNGFFNRQMTETRRVSSDAITLNVLPVPPSFTDPAWLSAESLELKETWSAQSLQTKVGEPLTRTITLTAKGATVGQLPELSKPPAIQGIKTYPDQPLLKEDKQSDGLIAVREEKIAYIAGQPGRYTLPALAISWFNTKTQQTEVARLPALELTALGASGNSQAAMPDAQPQQQPAAEAPGPDVSGNALFWQALSGFLGLGWLTHLLWLYRRAKIPRVSEPLQSEKQAKSDRQKPLKTACLHNNPQAAKQALLEWGRQHFAADNLTALADRCAEPLRAEIQLLNQYLYSAAQTDWDGRPLWDAFSKTGIAAKTHSEPDEVLAPLYKI